VYRRVLLNNSKNCASGYELGSNTNEVFHSWISGDRSQREIEVTLGIYQEMTVDDLVRVIIDPQLCKIFTMTSTLSASFKSSRNRCGWIVLLACALHQALSPAGVVVAESPNSFPYIYATRNNHNASFPVIEYFAPTGRALDHDKPAFLYNKDQGYRIVVFYGYVDIQAVSTTPQ
jgi:hypothetical protein